MKTPAILRRRARRVTPRLALVELLEVRRLLADTTWKGTTDSNFSLPGNWTAGVPGAGDNAIFDAATAVRFTVSLSAAPAAFAAMQVESGTFSLDLNGFDLTVTGNQGLSIANPGGSTAELTLTNSAGGASKFTTPGLTVAAGNSSVGHLTVTRSNAKVTLDARGSAIGVAIGQDSLGSMTVDQGDEVKGTYLGAGKGQDADGYVTVDGTNTRAHCILLARKQLKDVTVVA